MKKETHVILRVTPEFKEQLSSYCKGKDLKMSTFIREAVENKIKRG